MISERGIVQRGLISRGLARRGTVGSGSGGIFPAPLADIVWWGKDGVDPSTVNTVNDAIGVIDGAKYVNNNCLQFGAIGARVRIPTSATTNDFFGACTISGYVLFDDLAGLYVMFALGQGCYRLYYSNTSGDVKLNASTSTGWTPTAGIPYFVEVDFDSAGQATQLRVDGDPKWSGIAPAGILSGSSFTIGDINGGGYLKGLISDVKVTGSNGFHFPMCEGANDPTKLLIDISGNGVVPTQNSATWTTSDLMPAININRGFTYLEYSGLALDSIPDLDLIPDLDSIPV